MPRLRSGLLAAWTTAWFDGAVGADDVLDAVGGRDAPHEVVGLPDDEGPVGGAGRAGGVGTVRTLGAALIALRGRSDAVRLVLPAAGDVRGLPPSAAALRAAALEAGEAVLCGDLALVPGITRHVLSSAPTRVTWQAFGVEPAPEDAVSVAQAANELAEAMRETADALQAAALDAARADPGDGLARARRAGERLDLPPGFPPRAVSLLAQAERLHAALALALADPLGGAVDRTGIDARRAALAPLITAVRRARLAGYNAVGEARQRGAA